MAKKKVVKSQKTSSGKESSFEESLGALEGIVEELEAGKLGLAEALTRYESGVTHLKQCHALLEKAERKIELLSGVDADGNPITEDFDECATNSLNEKSAARSKRRGRMSKTSRSSGADDADVDGEPSLF